MATCKHCGKTLILKNGVCIYCGISPNEHIRKGSDESPKTDLPPVKVFNIEGVSFKMILVEGGKFYMGLTPKEAQNLMNEGVDWRRKAPIVSVDSYYICETVVTQALWKAIMNMSTVTQAFWKSSLLGDINNPSKYKGDNLPVDNVSWNNCQEFIERLNAFMGLRFRLPTEAEWEFASKGGNLSKGYEFSGSNNLSDVAWVLDEGQQAYSNTTKPIKTKLPNELGIYDMTGNVWEWCQDEYDEIAVEKYGDRSGNHQEVCLGLRGTKILRGFSAFSYASTICNYPSYRKYQYPNLRNPSLSDNGYKIEGWGYDAFGFRLAMNADKQ